MLVTSRREDDRVVCGGPHGRAIASSLSLGYSGILIVLYVMNLFSIIENRWIVYEWGRL